MKCLESIAAKCSDSKTVGDLVKLLFGVLNGNLYRTKKSNYFIDLNLWKMSGKIAGSNGKLSLVGQKISVLQAIKALSHNGVNVMKQTNENVDLVCENFILWLKDESKLHLHFLIVSRD